MFMKSTRLFFRSLLTYSRTIRNTELYSVSIPTSFTPKSLILLSTPSHLTSTIDTAIDLFEKKKLQIVVAGVDSVPTSGSKGVSELWLDEYFKIKSGTFLDEKDDLNKPPRQSDGIDVVGARKNWKIIDSSFRMQLAQNADVSVALANTAFVNNNLVTLFYLQPPQVESEVGEKFSDRTLCELTIESPTSTLNSALTITDRWTTLNGEEPLYVTNSVGNIIKSLNNSSAAKYLENNKKLMDIGSKDTEVYVKLFRKEKEYRYQVIAGGGGWGPKSDTLVISPEAKVQKGDRIEFFMLTPDNKMNLMREGNELRTQGSFLFERILGSQGYNENTPNLEPSSPVFGCGSEVGFHVNGVLHLSAGEKVEVKLE